MIVFFNDGLSVAVQKISKKYKINPEKIEDVLNGEFSKEYRIGLITPEKFWKKAGVELGTKSVEEIKNIFFSSYWPNKETIEIIKKLKSKRVKVAYLSNSPKDRAEYLDKKYKFISLFDFGMFSFEAHSWKA